MRAGAELAGLPLPAVLAELETSPRGLTGEQARARLERFGPNEIAEKHTSPVLVLLGYFWAPIPWMIEVALVLSLVLRHWPDAAVIGVLLVMNVAVAFTEEHQAATRSPRSSSGWRPPPGCCAMAPGRPCRCGNWCRGT